MAVELTTTVRVDGAPAELLPELAARLEDAVRRAIQDLGMAGITAYYASVDTAVEDIRVGLRFNGLLEEHIEETADEVLELAFQLAERSNGAAVSEVTRVGSQLVGA